MLISIDAHADDNPRLTGYPPNRLMGFLGLDSSNSKQNIQDGRAVDLLNVKLSTALDLRKRYGYSVINGKSLDDLDYAVDTVNGIFDAEYSTGSFTIAFNGRKIKYDNSGVWTNVSGSANISTGQDYQFICTMALDNAICTNGFDVPLKVSGTPVHSDVSFTGLSSSVTKAETVVWFQNYLIFANTTEGSTARPTRFRWSNVGTINAWDNSDFVDLSSYGGDEIVSVKEMYGDLYVFMRKSIWKASLVGGNDVFTFAKLIDGVGAIAKNGTQVVTLPGDRLGIIFLSEEKKIYLFNGVTVTDIGQIIRDSLDTLNEARLEFAVSAFDGHSYYLSVSSGGASSNDTIYEYQTEIGEWTKHDQINANAMARVKESTSIIKTYFGDYSSFVYWMDNPDNFNDVDGAQGIIDYVVTSNTSTETGVQVIVDTGLTAGVYTGAIIRITSGTGSGQERVILSGLTTGIIVSTAFSTTPDSTSLYSIGAIDSAYQSKWFDFGDAPRMKGFRSMYLWAEEQSSSAVDTEYSIDFGGVSGSETINLTPSGNSAWDTAIWDSATWGTTGDKFYTAKQAGYGRFLSITFSNDDIDKTFHLNGYHLLADSLDRE